VSRGTLAAASVIVAAAFVAYGATLDNYFVQDDFGVVWLLSQKPAGYFPTWFVTSWMDTIWGFTPDEVRPFVAVTYQAAAIPGAGTPWPNHLINIAIHAGTALLVWGVARHAGGVGAVAAMVAAVVFVVLPNHAETAAWMTGRVDSMPAFFYLAAFLAWVRWRHTRDRSAYLWSIAWCFVALFSKQNTITLVPALMLYDWIVERRPVAIAPSSWRAYVPHAVLTAGYLFLRYQLFGEVAREGQLTADRLGFFLDDAGQHIARIVLGNEEIAGIPYWGAALAIAMCLLGRRAIYFGIIWLALGLLPTLMSTYSSTRHAYLAAAGWAIVVGIGFDRLWLRDTQRARIAAGAAAAVMIGAYGFQLNAHIEDWDRRALVARKVVIDLERVAVSSPPGTLVLVGAPPSSFGFALPFAARPPFVSSDLTARARLVFHSSLNCCPADLWEPQMRSTLRAWLEDPARPPVVGLSWNPSTGQLSRANEADVPSLRTLMRLMAGTGSRSALDGTIDRIVAEVATVGYAGPNR